MHILRRVRFGRLRIVSSVLAAGLVVATSLSLHAAAYTYGSSNYGNCTYSTCPAPSASSAPAPPPAAPPQHTIIQTPSGLQVAVNLIDNQTIVNRGSGYTITLTPLNGAGTSFKNADIYIDGHLARSGPPGPDGTVNWVWDTKAHPGTSVKIVLTDNLGNITTREFNVKLVSVTRPDVAALNGSLTPTNNTGNIFTQALKAIKNYISRLSEPVIYAFPWLLFALLAIEIVVLLLQIKRELREQRILKELSDREHAMSDLKQTFSQLIAHYLRTPLTILKSGAEALVVEGPAQNTRAQLMEVSKQLGDTVESLVQTEAAEAVSVGGDQPIVPLQSLTYQIGRQVAIWLPVVLVGLVAFCFGYLANHVSRYHTNLINIFTQIALYSVLVVTIYQIMRRMRLHRSDLAREQATLASQQAIQASHDAFIHDAADKLTGHVETLQGLAGKLPTNAKNAQFIDKGLEQLKTLQSKLFIASHLKGSRSTEPYAPVAAQAIYDAAVSELQPAAEAKKISLEGFHDTPFSCQNQGLLSVVLHNLVDNAIAFSPEDSTVAITADSHDKQAALTVTDSGSGIERSKLELVPNAFFKAEGAETFDHEGMGFNLYLDRIIMAYLGGGLDIDSDPGKRTTVSAWWATL